MPVNDSLPIAYLRFFGGTATTECTEWEKRFPESFETATAWNRRKRCEKRKETARLSLGVGKTHFKHIFSSHNFRRTKKCCTPCSTAFETHSPTILLVAPTLFLTTLTTKEKKIFQSRYTWKSQLMRFTSWSSADYLILMGSMALSWTARKIWFRKVEKTSFLFLELDRRWSLIFHRETKSNNKRVKQVT